VLSRVRSQQLESTPRLLVVDSGSTDGTAELARRWADRVLAIDPASFDHGATRALAIRETDSDLVAFLVQDALPAGRHWLAPLVAAFADRQVAGAYSRQLPREGGNFFVIDRQSRSPIGGSSWRRQEIRDRLAFERQPAIDRLTACTFDNVASCVRRQVALEIELRRVRFGEDVDWAQRVLAAGHAIVYEPASAVYHSHDRGAWYELRRAYVSHQQLNRAFGLRLVPQGADVLRCAAQEHRRLRQLIAGHQGLSPARRRALAWQALPFAFGQTLGVWLGALSAKGLTDGRRIFGAIDRLLSGGI
jgi:rhamnosyltransferase